MPFYAGQQGKLLIDGKKAAKVVNWSFSSSQAVLDTTTLGDTDRTLIYGIRSLSGSCRLFYYYYSVGGQRQNDCALLMSKIMKTADTSQPGDGENEESDPVELSLNVEDMNGERNLIIPALITGVSMTMGVGEVLAADITFESNGAPYQAGSNITTASEQAKTVLS